MYMQKLKVYSALCNLELKVYTETIYFSLMALVQ